MKIIVVAALLVLALTGCASTDGDRVLSYELSDEGNLVECTLVMQSGAYTFVWLCEFKNDDCYLYKTYRGGGISCKFGDQAISG